MKTLSYSKSKGSFWFRLFGYGLNFLDRAIHPAPFSVRNGYRNQLRVYRTWYVMVLTAKDLK